LEALEAAVSGFGPRVSSRVKPPRLGGHETRNRIFSATHERRLPQEMPPLRRRSSAVAHEHLRLHLLLLEEALETRHVLLGGREGVPLGLHGLRRRPLLSGPPARGRRGVSLDARDGARPRRISRHHQALIGIGYLDGNRLSRAIIAGAHFV